MSHQPTNDQLRRWVEASRSGDRVAFGSLVEATWASLVGLARVTLAEQGGQAEDVVQESLCLAWQDLPALRDPAAFRPWLHRIVVRTAIRLRTRSRRDGDRLREIELPSVGRHPERDGSLERALGKLSARQRAVLYLGEVEGYSDAEVSDALDIRPATVRVHRLRGRQRLRQLLGMDASPPLDRGSRPDSMRTQE